MKKNDDLLRMLFDKLNKEHWNCKLPRIPVRFSEEMAFTTQGEYHPAPNKDKDNKYNYKIFINKRIQSISQIEKTLLHEMCHHSIFIQNKEKYWNEEIWWHGKEWKKEMERVGFKRPITRFS